jgi:hypothetical protein
VVNRWRFRSACGVYTSVLNAFVTGILLVQAVSATPSTPAPVRLDSTELARLRARLEDRRDVRVRIDRDYVELTQPVFLDTAIAYRRAWSDRLDDRDTTLTNPLPLARISSIQVRGKTVWQPMLGGGLSLGVTVLASTLLNGLVNSNDDLDASTVARLTLMGVGVGAALGAADGALRTRWVTIYRREER